MRYEHAQICISSINHMTHMNYHRNLFHVKFISSDHFQTESSMAARKQYTGEEASSLIMVMLKDRNNDCSSDSSFNSESDEEDCFDTPLQPKLVNTAEEVLDCYSDNNQNKTNSSIDKDSVDSEETDKSDVIQPKKRQKLSITRHNNNTDHSWRMLEQSDMQDSPSINISFQPQHTPGVREHIDDKYTTIDCFFELFTVEVQECLVTLINEHAQLKCAINNPPTKYSLYASWSPITRYELIKFFAITIAM